MTYCQVIVDIAFEQVDRVFTYRIPEGLDLLPGMRVMVPFGGRKVEGYVVELCETTDLPPEKVREVQRALEEYPVILPQMMRLARWLKESAHCTLAQALRLMFPAQMRASRIVEKKQRFYECIVPQEGSDQAVESLARARTQQKVLEYLIAHGRTAAQELTAAFPNSPAAVRALIDKGLVRSSEQEVFRRPYEVIPGQQVQDPVLTPDQAGVLAQALPELHAGRGKYLLHGITGSGKTEIFIRLIRETLAMGKRAIVLVPEIALTPQMVDWFRARFGEDTAVLHSRLTAGQRYDEWRRVRAGDASVVIGARSAVFAPVENLGLLIIDEEHEQSYVSEHTPQYDARQVAEKRCENEGATLLLASATPGMRSFARALRGELSLLELPRRVFGNLPEVTLVDMRDELALGNQSVLSGALAQALRECLRGGQQAMLMMNRRGYSTFVSCRKCGHVVQCPNCDISLTYHQSGEAVRCHYCGHSAPPPDTCPECGSAQIRFFGAGTQKVEETVRKQFPQARILRMDVDTTRTRDAHAMLLQQFRDREADILIGTQMIAKGLDFPEVTLVGVIAADSTLHLPDYRSAERTFQLVTQVAGRAGRAGKPGRVFVQTYTPEHYAIENALHQDYRAFYETEMQWRRRRLYPPYTMLARMMAEGDDAQGVRAEVARAQQWLEAWMQDKPGQQKVTLSMRATEAPVKRLRGKERAMLLLKLIDTPPAAPVLDALNEYMQGIPFEGLRYLEINPASLM